MPDSGLTARADRGEVLAGVSPRRSGLVLGVGTATMMLVLSMPNMAMSVLFPSIASDLGLTLVQVGVIWGIAPLAGVLFGLLGGIVADVRGARRVVALASLSCAVVGASRGLAGGFWMLAALTLLLGMAGSAIPNNLHKVAGHWFSSKALGTANSVLSLGAAGGALLGSLVSASLLSPWLGGWRHVMFFYGVVAAVIAVAWLLSPDEPGAHERRRASLSPGAIRRTLSLVASVRAFWVLAAVGLCYSAYYQGFAGYLPLYLTGKGWSTPAASGALAAFSAASMVGVIPITLLAERVHARRGAMAVTGTLAVAGLIVLALSAGPWVWPVVIAMGLFHDVFMSISITLVVQTDGIGPALAGTALGIAMSMGRLGGFVSPPLGNSLAALGPGAPFLLWAGFAAAMLLLLTRVRRVRPHTTSGVSTPTLRVSTN